MLKSVLFAALLVVGQKAEAPKGPVQLGTIAGAVIPPPGTTIKQPLQVILLSQAYSNLWTAEVQQREDNSWERYKPALAQKKELFFELSRQAYLDAIQYVEDRMRLELGSNFLKFSKATAPDGKFEFRGVPLGDYRVLAVGRVSAQQYVWSDWATLTSSTPQLVQLKKLP